MSLRLLFIPIVLLGACQAPSGNDSNDQGPSSGEVAASGAPADNTQTQSPTPDANSVSEGEPPTGSLPEPIGPIDPKSVEAAGQVVQTYGALIEQQRWGEARRLWSDAAAADAFARRLRDHREVHLNIGELGEPEGAAGSIYVTEPVTFYGIVADGRSFERAAIVTLRRVNDVPGSTPRQRRWHIQQIEWTSSS